MVCEPCEKVLHEESSLNPHMQKASDMENDDQKGRSSDELTHNEPKRKNNDEIDDERKIDSESSARRKPAYDALENVFFENGTEESTKQESVEHPKIEEDENIRFQHLECNGWRIL